MSGDRYKSLREDIESIQTSALRDKLLGEIAVLNCDHMDPTFCDPERQKDWPKLRIDDSAYAKALAEELKKLVCSGDDDAIYVLNRLPISPSDRLLATAQETPKLIDFILSRDCPVSAALTDTDKGELLQIKQNAVERAEQEPVH
jgi:hypothetical protein